MATSGGNIVQMRVRFPPSPTGYLHIGNLRVAIFNWLFARHNNGKFLVRIEDTDLERSKQEYTDSILDILDWMNMSSDEPIVIQSKRVPEHMQLIHKLIAEKKAYICTCPRRNTQEFESDETHSKYPGTCRDKGFTFDTVGNISYVIRFKLPEFKKGDSVSFDDLILGNISVSEEQLDDFILIRSDGMPTYNFACVADDIFMNVTHVIRGPDHVNNTPKQILIYKALNAQLPKFAHLPLITNEEGAKLSKRDAAVSALDYKKSGFLEDALFNYLVRLGWSHGDQEIFTKEELIKYFSLEHVGKSPAVFDLKKLEWFNGVYIKQKTSRMLFDCIVHDVDLEFRKKIKNFDDQQIFALIDLYKERVKTLKNLSNEVISLDNVPVKYEEIGLAELNANTKNYLRELVLHLEKVNTWNEDELSNVIKQLCKQLQIKLPVIAQPIRLALTGTITSPGIFHLLSIFGKEESIKRINIFIEFLNN